MSESEAKLDAIAERAAAPAIAMLNKMRQLTKERDELRKALQLARRRICELIDANPGVSPVNHAANRAVNEIDRVFANLNKTDGDQ